MRQLSHLNANSRKTVFGDSVVGWHADWWTGAVWVPETANAAAKTPEPVSRNRQDRGARPCGAGEDGPVSSQL